ncbi:MAG TPA: alpha-amylase family protein [Gemmatimonadales bacterium]|jgi:alpha-amylase|nr:alpha-amylase family protein [Gemmatimonadales bacterium]
MSNLTKALLVVALTACNDDLPMPPGGGGGLPVRPTLPTTYRPSGHMAAGDVMVHLFEWPWPDIAAECENVLGPAGFQAVQISPPQEHSITPSHDWSERYQPVRYTIARSRSGTEAEFADMVNRCRTAGVGIIVDAVINHMTNYPSPGTGSNGSPYSKYDYPGLYSSGDFHPACALTNYQSAANVQDCELFSLPDLNTLLPSVRTKIAGYLTMLARLGVEGFRIDAAKHIQQVDLDAIFQIVDSTAVAEARPIPYYFLEVVGNGQGEALGPYDYYGEAYSSGGAADITEFTFAGVGDKFRGIGGQHLSELNPGQFPGTWGMMPSDKALVFLQNHDTQHQCGLSYRDGNVFRLANVFMLAQPYGYPSILSSYAFSCPSENSMGPVSDANGWTLPVSCAASLEAATSSGHWVCEHRDPYILTMVAFRGIVAGTDVNHWWDDGANAIAFSRGDKGFVAINGGSTMLTGTVTTGMAAGAYRDLLSAATVVVDSAGSVQLNLAARSAVAIDVATRLP